MNIGRKDATMDTRLQDKLAIDARRWDDIPAVVVEDADAADAWQAYYDDSAAAAADTSGTR